MLKIPVPIRPLQDCFDWAVDTCLLKKRCGMAYAAGYSASKCARLDSSLGARSADAVAEEVPDDARVIAVQKPRGSRTAITLPRISLSFPAVSLRVTLQLIINSKEKPAEEWFYSSNALPYLLTYGGKHWPEHLKMQEELSKRYNEGRTPKESNPARFASFALRTSEFSEEGKKILLTDLEEAVEFHGLGMVGAEAYKVWKTARERQDGAQAPLTAGSSKPPQRGSEP
ncbi:hypothetical protein FJT64_014894 [Amphibalanus amphitrite]|uniref:Uncharacterized protein n=1 Tax=Amphibalanus amphitrite TaxID=1232801 RepID=A0A6A4XF25_AMPAM|nr:hypothetical protein FJT64_014894 [Amphibalanus amphitrite]